MSAIASPLSFIALLTGTSQQIVTETTTSFRPSRTNEKGYEVSLNCHQKKADLGSFQTKFQIIFKTAAEMNECVAAFLKADLHPYGLVVCERIRPTAKTERATIDLDLFTPEDLANLKKYSKELIPLEWDLETDETAGRPYARLRHKESHDSAAQKTLLDRELPRVVKKLTFSFSLNQMLAQNRDAEFPGIPTKESGCSCMDWKSSLDLGRSYRIGPFGLFEELHIPGLHLPQDRDDSLFPVTALEVEEWLLDPASQKGKALKKCVAVFEYTFQKALKELAKDPANSAKIARMAEAASQEPDFAAALAKFHAQ